MTTTIIQFIGLLLFSYQFTPGQNHLQALAPRITSAPLGRGHSGATAIVDPGVGDHATYIAFAKVDYISNKGWVPQELPTNQDQYYVRLDGEQVEFKGATLAGPRAEDGLKLPHLTACCTGNQVDERPTLKKEFRPPFSGAAAVFDLRAGRMQNCNGVIDGEETDRADTVVQLDTNRTLTISATLRGTGAKEIKLRGGSHVVVANLPLDAITGVNAPATTSPPSPHFTAYYAMMEKAPKCAGDLHCARATSSSNAPCERQAIRQTRQTTAAARTRARQTGRAFTAHASDLTVVDVNNQIPQPLDTYLRINFECSNSQWP